MNNSPIPRYVVERDCVEYLRIKDNTRHAYRQEVLLAINTNHNIEQFKELMQDFFKEAWQLTYRQCVAETNRIVRGCSEIYEVYVACYRYLIEYASPEIYDGKYNCGPADRFCNMLHSLFDSM